MDGTFIGLGAFIACVAAFCAFGATIFGSIADREMKWGLFIFFILAAGIGVGGMFGYFKIQDGLDADRHTEIIATEHIKALRDGSDINGKFHGSAFGMSGYINEKLYFTYLIDLGAYDKIGKIEADRTRIYEIEDGDYRVEWCKEVAKYKMWSTESEYNWRLYIPPNSIVNDFEIDLG